MDYKKCSTHTNKKIIVLEENRSRFQLNNKNCIPAKIIQVDGCLIDSDHEKCDWIVTHDQPEKTAIYIELKGCNLDKAISQLKSTLKLTTQEFRDHTKRCYAVTTRVPKQQTSVRIKCIQFQKETKAILSVKNQNCAVDLE